MIKHRLRRLEAFLNHCDLGRRTNPAPRPLQNIQDLIDLLQEQADAIRADPWAGAIEKARALAYLAGVARRTLETGTLARRLELMELVLKKRKRNSQ
jgi:hypothetical protein